MRHQVRWTKMDLGKNIHGLCKNLDFIVIKKMRKSFLLVMCLMDFHVVFQNGLLLDTWGVSARLDYKVNVGPFSTFRCQNTLRETRQCRLDLSRRKTARQAKRPLLPMFKSQILNLLVKHHWCEIFYTKNRGYSYRYPVWALPSCSAPGLSAPHLGSRAPCY